MKDQVGARAAIAKWEVLAKTHQLKWLAERERSYRNILTDRQVGITRAMATEGYIVSLETGRKQVFIAASIAQAEIFKRYILDFSKHETLPRGDFKFLSPETFCSQGVGGNGEYDVYLDEYLWMTDKQLKSLLISFDANKPVRQTLMSSRTPDSRHLLLEQVTDRSEGVELGELH